MCLHTPLTAVATRMANWLDIYSGVLLVRVLLSWFPNIPWDRQPLSSIRDLFVPYLNLFRNIIPPVVVAILNKREKEERRATVTLGVILVLHYAGALKWCQGAELGYRAATQSCRSDGIARGSPSSLIF
ncbi:hypothetical protein L1987_11239 [Smallanthus sonchifolius]|uniref:Uncharacterized protein n=1 Tax=Smallanthus sonchifolius TaxID=185202 RepID=A0ACB9JAE4_9ASTR|nr:hypothetical protein L1987_11239 [Smallanthus sonchifolius]